MEATKIKKILLERGLTEDETKTLIDLVKASQKSPQFVATVKRRSASNMSAVVSICFKCGNYFRSLDFFAHTLTHYKWSKDRDGLIVHGCGFNRIFAILDDVAEIMKLTGKERTNFTQYFTL